MRQATGQATADADLRATLTQVTTATAWESQGNIELALAEYEKALTADPLNLQLQQRYWTLKQRGVKPTPPPDNGPKGQDVPGLRRRRS